MKNDIINSSRYSRNTNVEGFTPEQQELLLNSKVLIVGAGGLGSAVINYLTMAGVGTIGVVEYDTVSESNLQRQILYTESDLNKNKGEIAIKTIREKNKKCHTILYNRRYTKENSIEITTGYDLIIDCSDNYEARHAMDHASKELSIPFLYGSAEQLQGQVSTFNSGGAGSYHDLFGTTPPSKENTILGVLTPIPGIVGSIQALEAIKLLTDMKDNLCGKLLLIDGVSYKTTIFTI